MDEWMDRRKGGQTDFLIQAPQSGVRGAGAWIYAPTATDYALRAARPQCRRQLTRSSAKEPPAARPKSHPKFDRSAVCSSPAVPPEARPKCRPQRPSCLCCHPKCPHETISHKYVSSNVQVIRNFSSGIFRSFSLSLYDYAD